MASARFSAMLVSMLLALAPGALAADAVAPPGNAGVDQYLEAVPTVRGASRPTTAKAPVLPQAATGALRASGKDGRALEQLVNAQAPAAARRAAHAPNSERTGATTAKADTAALERPGSSVARSALTALTDGSDGGMGLALPALLLGSAAFFAAAVIRRARR